MPERGPRDDPGWFQGPECQPRFHPADQSVPDENPEGIVCSTHNFRGTRNHQRDRHRKARYLQRRVRCQSLIYSDSELWLKVVRGRDGVEKSGVTGLTIQL